MALGKPRKRKPGESRSSWKRSKRSDLKGGFTNRHLMKKAEKEAAKKLAKREALEAGE